MVFNTSAQKLTAAQGNIKNIVVTTDFSESSDFAISMAIKIAEATQAKLTILHVVQKDFFDIGKILEKIAPKEMLQNPAEYSEILMLEKIRSLLRHKLNIDYAILSKGKPAVKILQYTRKNEVDLLVMGAHGRRYTRDLFVGTTAEFIAKETRCPVLIVKNPPRKLYHKILVPVDYSERSKQALSYAIRVFPNSSKTIIHVGDYEYEDILKREENGDSVRKSILIKMRKAILLYLNNKMKNFIKEYANKLGKYTCKVMVGYPGPTILKEAEKLNSDLIVMGTQGHVRHYFLFVGVIVNWIMSESGKDVLLVPPKVNK